MDFSLLKRIKKDLFKTAAPLHEKPENMDKLRRDPDPVKKDPEHSSREETRTPQEEALSRRREQSGGTDPDEVPSYTPEKTVGMDMGRVDDLQTRDELIYQVLKAIVNNTMLYLNSIVTNKNKAFQVAEAVREVEGIRKEYARTEGRKARVVLDAVYEEQKKLDATINSKENLAELARLEKMAADLSGAADTAINNLKKEMGRGSIALPPRAPEREDLAPENQELLQQAETEAEEAAVNEVVKKAVEESTAEKGAPPTEEETQAIMENARSSPEVAEAKSRAYNEFMIGQIPESAPAGSKVQVMPTRSLELANVVHKEYSELDESTMEKALAKLKIPAEISEQEKTDIRNIFEVIPMAKDEIVTVFQRSMTRVLGSLKMSGRNLDEGYKLRIAITKQFLKRLKMDMTRLRANAGQHEQPVYRELETIADIGNSLLDGFQESAETVRALNDTLDNILGKPMQTEGQDIETEQVESLKEKKSSLSRGAAAIAEPEIIDASMEGINLDWMKDVRDLPGYVAHAKKTLSDISNLHTDHEDDYIANLNDAAEGATEAFKSISSADKILDWVVKSTSKFMSEFQSSRQEFIQSVNSLVEEFSGDMPYAGYEAASDPAQYAPAQQATAGLSASAAMPERERKRLERKHRSKTRKEDEESAAPAKAPKKEKSEHQKAEKEQKKDISKKRKEIRDKQPSERPDYIDIGPSEKKEPEDDSRRKIEPGLGKLEPDPDKPGKMKPATYTVPKSNKHYQVPGAYRNQYGTDVVETGVQNPSQRLDALEPRIDALDESTKQEAIKYLELLALKETEDDYNLRLKEGRNPELSELTPEEQKRLDAAKASGEIEALGKEYAGVARDLKDLSDIYRYIDISQDKDRYRPGDAELYAQLEGKEKRRQPLTADEERELARLKEAQVADFMRQQLTDSEEARKEHRKFKKNVKDMSQYDITTQRALQEIKEMTGKVINLQEMGTEKLKSLTPEIDKGPDKGHQIMLQEGIDKRHIQGALTHTKNLLEQFSFHMLNVAESRKNKKVLGNNLWALYLTLAEEVQAFNQVINEMEAQSLKTGDSQLAMNRLTYGRTAEGLRLISSIPEKYWKKFMVIMEQQEPLTEEELADGKKIKEKMKMEAYPNANLLFNAIISEKKKNVATGEWEDYSKKFSPLERALSEKAAESGDLSYQETALRLAKNSDRLKDIFRAVVSYGQTYSDKVQVREKGQGTVPAAYQKAMDLFEASGGYKHFVKRMKQWLPDLIRELTPAEIQHAVSVGAPAPKPGLEHEHEEDLTTGPAQIMRAQQLVADIVEMVETGDASKFNDEKRKVLDQLLDVVGTKPGAQEALDAFTKMEEGQPSLKVQFVLDRIKENIGHLFGITGDEGVEEIPESKQVRVENHHKWGTIYIIQRTDGNWNIYQTHDNERVRQITEKEYDEIVDDIEKGWKEEDSPSKEALPKENDNPNEEENKIEVDSSLTGLVRMAEEALDYGSEDVVLLEEEEEATVISSIIDAVREAKESFIQSMSAGQEHDAKYGDAAEPANEFGDLVDYTAAALQEVMDAPEDTPAEAPMESVASKIGSFFRDTFGITAGKKKTVKASGRKGMKKEAADFSQFDLSDSKLDLVEGEDGSKSLVLNKNLKNLVTKRINDMEKGSQKVGDVVQIDFGHYIGTGTVKAYLGGGVFRIAEINGQTMDVPENKIFSANGIWR